MSWPVCDEKYTLKATVDPDERYLVADRPAPAGDPVARDLSLEGWWAAEGRSHAGQAKPGSPARMGVPAPPLDLSTPSSSAPSSYGQPSSAQPSSAQRQPKARWRLVFTRLWAIIKMASLAYTTWWAMGYIHARAGEAICGYGAVCLFAGFGARWRRRFFGPGQLLEPELYEEVGSWFYRAGVLGVLVGGAIYFFQFFSSAR